MTSVDPAALLRQATQQVQDITPALQNFAQAVGQAASPLAHTLGQEAGAGAQQGLFGGTAGSSSRLNIVDVGVMLGGSVALAFLAFAYSRAGHSESSDELAHRIVRQTLVGGRAGRTRTPFS